VIDGDVFVGLVSIGDVVKSVIAQQARNWSTWSATSAGGIRGGVTQALASRGVGLRFLLTPRGVVPVGTLSRGGF
jgi:hypothetical protein